MADIKATEIMEVLVHTQQKGEADPDKRLDLDENLSDQRQSESQTAPNRSPTGEDTKVQPLGNKVNDARFIRDLERLKELRSFLIQEAVSVSPAESAALEFGRLNSLKYSPIHPGRDPTEEEWRQVERLTRTLFGLMTPALRRRFVLGSVPGMLTWLPIILTLVALASLTLATLSYATRFVGLPDRGANVLPFYLIWLVSLGAIGATAFIGMNALSVQEDITFDLTNRRLITLRIALGALFGLVITLPFGFNGFIDFCGAILDPRAPGTTERPNTSTVTLQAGMLILPFILGFSTSLVILILNRFVDAVQSFFGRREGRDGGETKPQRRLPREGLPPGGLSNELEHPKGHPSRKAAAKPVSGGVRDTGSQAAAGRRLRAVRDDPRVGTGSSTQGEATAFGRLG